MDYKGAGDGRVSQKCLKQVSLRLGFASEGWHNDLAQYYYSIFCWRGAVGLGGRIPPWNDAILAVSGGGTRIARVLDRR